MDWWAAITVETRWLCLSVGRSPDIFAIYGVVIGRASCVATPTRVSLRLLGCRVRFRSPQSLVGVGLSLVGVGI